MKIMIENWVECIESLRSTGVWYSKSWSLTLSSVKLKLLVQARTKIFEEFTLSSELLSIKVTDSCPASHEFKPSAIEDTPCRGVMYVKSIESSNVLLLVWKLGEGAAQVSSSSLDHMARNCEVRHQRPSSSRIVRR
ncbi:hypothetical protein TNCV_1453561 [Trichonephila clavipes]|nr:hypothetical protein TNCV_1453561 [Trichonephila clavipes]